MKPTDVRTASARAGHPLPPPGRRPLALFLTGLLVAGCGEGARDGAGPSAEALEHFERGRVSLNGSTVELGSLNFDRESLGRAVASFERAIELEPGIALFHTCLGLAHERMDDMEEAESAFSAALRLDPDDLVALVHRSTTRRAAGRLEEAARDLERALRVDPSSFVALNRLGLLRLGTGEWEAAAAAFERATRADPENAEPWSGLHTALRRLGRDDEADRALERYRVCRDRAYREAWEPLAHYQRGLELMEERRLDEARAAFEQALALEPDAAEPRAGIGRIHLWRGELEEARGVLEEALALDPTDEDVRFDLAVVLVRQGEEDSAAEQARELLAANPENDRARRLLADLGKGTGD